jgi:hypothetical protein
MDQYYPNSSRQKRQLILRDGFEHTYTTKKIIPETSAFIPERNSATIFAAYDLAVFRFALSFLPRCLTFFEALSPAVPLHPAAVAACILPRIDCLIIENRCPSPAKYDSPECGMVTNQDLVQPHRVEVCFYPSAFMWLCCCAFCALASAVQPGGVALHMRRGVMGLSRCRCGKPNSSAKDCKPEE